MNEFLIVLVHTYREHISKCGCYVRPRKIGEDVREWVKDISCMYHWMKTSYYKRKLKFSKP